MINRKIFFQEYKQTIDKDKSISNQEVKDIDTLLDNIDTHFCELDINQWAYFLATTFHETNFTMAPVVEAYHLSESWRKRNLRYYPYHGRGYVQITWLANYQKFAKMLNIDLVNKPELALIPKHAFQIALKGFKLGSFTRKKMSDYVVGTKKDYKGARRIINGTDKADTIAAYAELFEKILRKSVV